MKILFFLSVMIAALVVMQTATCVLVLSHYEHRAAQDALALERAERARAVTVQALVGNCTDVGGIAVPGYREVVCLRQSAGLWTQDAPR